MLYMYVNYTGWGEDPNITCGAQVTKGWNPAESNKHPVAVVLVQAALNLLSCPPAHEETHQLWQEQCED